MSARNDIVSKIQNIITASAQFKKVDQWKVSGFAPAECPCVSIRDTICLLESPRYGKQRHNLTVELVIVDTSNNSAENVRVLSDKALQSIGADKTLSGLCETVTATRVDMGTDDLGKQIALCTVTLNIIFEVDLYHL